MRAPAGLGAGGGRLWRSVASWLDQHPAGSVQLDPHERELLAEACRIADRLGAMREVLDGADLTDAGTVRLLAEERQQRLALATVLVTKLGLPSGMPEEASPKKGATPRSRRAQRAATARWGTPDHEATA